MRVTKAIVDALHSEGISHVFMVPGGFVDPFTDELAHRSDVKTITAAHEGGAIAMADGYSRASGKFGVAIGIAGPGLFNMTTGIYTAYMDASPILVISGEMRSEWQGRGFIQDTSPYGPVHGNAVMEQITSLSRTMQDTTNFDFHLRTMFRHMLAPTTRGPVHLAIPVNVQNGEVNSTHVSLTRQMRKPRLLDTDSCDGVAELIASHRHVAVVCGAGSSDASVTPLLKTFAERNVIPVVTTMAAKGVIPEDHPLSLGYFGWSGLRTAIETMLSNELEILIVLGSKMNTQDSLFWNERFHHLKALIHVDINEQSIGQHFPTHKPILGDAATFLRYIMQKLEQPELRRQVESTRPSRERWINGIVKLGPKVYYEENLSSSKTPIHPARVVGALRKSMPRDTTLVLDNGAHSFFTSHYWDCYEPNQFITSLRYVGAMGWAIGAGIGAKCARPDKPVVVVTGDGCMLMHGLEIQTAARYNLDIIFVVMNNSAFGNPYLRARQSGPEVAAMQMLPTHDWGVIAESLGAKGLSIKNPDELEAAFTHALRVGGTWVVNVFVGNESTPTEHFDKGLLSALRRGDTNV